MFSLKEGGFIPGILLEWGAYKAFPGGSCGKGRGFKSIVLNARLAFSYMHLFNVLLMGLLVVSAFSLVEAREVGSSVSTSPTTGMVAGVADPIVVVSSVPILPVSVRAARTQTLAGISATEKSTLDVLARERSDYQSIRSRLANASSSEQKSLRDSLALQRQRVLLAILNRLSILYQRVDLVISKMESSVLRLDIIHDQRGGVSEYDSRYTALKSQLSSIQSQSNEAARLLESCPTSVDLGACVRSAKDAVSGLLGALPSYYSAYRSLASDVLSA